MLMTLNLRKFALLAHITSSVGWLGSVAAFLALAIAGLSSGDAAMVRAAYLAMHLITWFVIVPLSVASLLTGLVESVGTPWGVYRHYWVVTKLMLTVFATILLLLHMQPIGRVASVAAETALSGGDLRQVRFQLVGDAAAALFLLLVTSALSVYKPWGVTPYGIRTQTEMSDGTHRGVNERSTGMSGRTALVGVIVFVVLLVLLHPLGGGLYAH